MEQPIGATHIEYFGFTLIDTYWDDPSDNLTKTNYIDEVSGFTNIADILVVSSSDDIVERISEMNKLEVKSVLHISELFFELVGSSSPSGTQYRLRSDYKERWHDFINVNNLQVNQNFVQAFYLGEEPTWNGISFSDLQLASDYIEQTLPDVPVMIIEAYPAVDQLQVPNSVDWIGFDHYFVKNPFIDSDYLNELRIIKSKFSNSKQKLVIVMDTHYMNSFHGDIGGIKLEEMDDVANSYYDLAKSEPKTIAIIGYFWPSGFDLPNSIGARNMPETIRDNYIRIGKQITNKE